MQGLLQWKLYYASNSKSLGCFEGIINTAYITEKLAMWLLARLLSPCFMPDSHSHMLYASFASSAGHTSKSTVQTANQISNLSKQTQILHERERTPSSNQTPGGNSGQSCPMVPMISKSRVISSRNVHCKNYLFILAQRCFNV